VELRRVGYWSDESGTDGPDPTLFVDRACDHRERESVIRYFNGGTIARAYMGRSLCRICGSANGSLELSDGRYLWPEGFAHYIEEHGVRPPEEVVRRALTRLEQLEDARVDDSWWLAATRDR
jgi:hypothetical protein